MKLLELGGHWFIVYVGSSRIRRGGREMGSGVWGGEVVLLPRDHLAISGDTFGCHS